LLQASFRSFGNQAQTPSLLRYTKGSSLLQPVGYMLYLNKAIRLLKDGIISLSGSANV
jgi:hypothetical protein